MSWTHQNDEPDGGESVQCWDSNGGTWVCSGCLYASSAVLWSYILSMNGAQHVCRWQPYCDVKGTALLEKLCGLKKDTRLAIKRSSPRPGSVWPLAKYITSRALIDCWWDMRSSSWRLYVSISNLWKPSLSNIGDAYLSPLELIWAQKLL